MNNIEIVKPLIYHRKGVRVDIVRIGSEYANETPNIVKLYAWKRNSLGFWDELAQDFIDKPLFINQSNQELHPRHNVNNFKNEKEVITRARTNPKLKTYVPEVTDTDDFSIATEYINGSLLEEINELGTLSVDARLKIICQLLEYIYLIHEINIYHNDFHGRSIIVENDLRIKVIDYSMSGKENISLQPGWDDIGRLNQNIIRTLVGNVVENVRPLTEIELSICQKLTPFLRFVPFSNDYPQLFDRFQQLIKP